MINTKNMATEVKFLIGDEQISVFTDRIDAIFGVTFIVVRDKNLGDEGVFTGRYAIHPFNNEKIEIRAANHGFGDNEYGIRVAIPAHDQKDFEFAKKYNLPIRDVISKDFQMQEKKPDEIIVPGVWGILFSPSRQKYCCIHIKETGLRVPISGGKNENETYEECMMREFEEEAGYGEIDKLIPLTELSFSRYYHPRKKDSRRGIFVPYLGIIENETEVERHLEAHEKDFEVMWIDAIDFLNNLNSRGEGKKVPHFEYRLKRAVCKAIELGYDNTSLIEEFETGAMSEKGILIRSGEFSGLESDEAVVRMEEWLNIQTN